MRINQIKKLTYFANQERLWNSCLQLLILDSPTYWSLSSLCGSKSSTRLYRPCNLCFMVLIVTSFKVLRPPAAFYSQPLAFCLLALIRQFFCSGESGFISSFHEKNPLPLLFKYLPRKLAPMKSMCTLPPQKKTKSFVRPRMFTSNCVCG